MFRLWIYVVSIFCIGGLSCFWIKFFLSPSYVFTQLVHIISIAHFRFVWIALIKKKIVLNFFTWKAVLNIIKRFTWAILFSMLYYNYIDHNLISNFFSPSCQVHVMHLNINGVFLNTIHNLNKCMYLCGTFITLLSIRYSGNSNICFRNGSTTTECRYLFSNNNSANIAITFISSSCPPIA